VHSDVLYACEEQLTIKIRSRMLVCNAIFI
jgi:hypothetical protein